MLYRDPEIPGLFELSLSAESWLVPAQTDVELGKCKQIRFYPSMAYPHSLVLASSALSRALSTQLWSTGTLACRFHLRLPQQAGPVRPRLCTSAMTFILRKWTQGGDSKGRTGSKVVGWKTLKSHIQILVSKILDKHFPLCLQPDSRDWLSSHPVIEELISTGSIHWQTHSPVKLVHARCTFPCFLLTSSPDGLNIMELKCQILELP